MCAFERSEKGMEFNMSIPNDQTWKMKDFNSEIIWKDSQNNVSFEECKVSRFIPFKHGAAVFGGEFGDEGKGKKVDALAEKYKKSGLKILSIRGQGSGNAGHTVVVDNKKYDFHYLTSAGLSADIMLLGAGMLIDPIRVLNEMEKLPLKKREIVMVAERATIVTNLERIFDGWCEAQHKDMKSKVGTTGSGVGPGAGIRGFRFNVTFADALKCKSADELREKFLSNPILPVEVKEATKPEETNVMLTKKVFSKEYVEEIWKAIHKLNIVDSVEIIQRCREEGGWAVLLEVSQAVGLDPLFGNGGHFVTSTPCTDVGGIVGSGLTIYDFPDGTTMMCKAYTSKVGGGPFIVKFNDDEKNIDKFIDDMVCERGVTTGRKRDLGWFDGPLVRHTIELTGANVSVNCMDVIAELPAVTDTVKVCFAYKNKITGNVTYRWPYNLNDYKPLYLSMSIKGMSKNDIIKNYILLIEKVIGQKILEYGVGPRREDYRLRDEAFKH